jgi:3-oxoacyl-[acyl-carrier-protein] synthase-3
MLESLGLDPTIDFASFETLGNTGAVALPLTLALGIEQGHLKQNDHAALLGIGSGINSIMLAVDWQRTLAAAPSAVPKPLGRGALLSRA